MGSWLEICANDLGISQTFRKIKHPINTHEDAKLFDTDNILGSVPKIKILYPYPGSSVYSQEGFLFASESEEEEKLLRPSTEGAAHLQSLYFFY